MDPLTITATCIGLVSTITKTSLLVVGFVKDVRSARSDLDSVLRELQSLKTVLELLTEDCTDSTKNIPQILQQQISGIVTNCSGVVVDIEQVLERHDGGKLAKATKWVASGKNEVIKLRSTLEAHKSALEIALDMVTLTLTREVKAHTQELLGDTSTIKETQTQILAGQAQILAEIARLQEQLPADLHQRSAGFMLDRYLEELTSYAETAYDPLFSDRPDEPQGSEHSSMRQQWKSAPTSPSCSRTSSSGPSRELGAEISDGPALANQNPKRRSTLARENHHAPQSALPELSKPPSRASHSVPTPPSSTSKQGNNDQEVEVGSESKQHPMLSYNPNTISSPAGDSTAAATSSTQDDALFRDPGLPQLQKHQDFKTSAISKNYSAIGGPAEQKRSVFAKLKLIIGGDSSSGNSKESQPFILSKQFEFDYYYTSSMTFVTDGYRVAGTSSRKNTSIQIWADRQGKFEPVQKLKGRTHRIIRAVFSPNGRWLASVEDGRLNAIRIWEEREGTYELVQQLSDLPKLLRDSVIFSRDGLRLAWIYSGNKTICIWEHRQGSFEQLQVLSVASYSTHAFSLAFSHDNRQLASNHTNGNINIWAVVGGGYAQVQELTYQPGSCFSVVFSPDGRLASRWRPSRDSKLGSILIWAKNYAGKFEKVQEMAHSRGLYIFSDLSFSSDGRWLVAGCYKAFTRIWADRQGIFVHVQDLDMGGSKWLTSGFSSSVLFSPDGCRLMETRLLTSNGSAPSRNLRIFQGPEEIT